ncbi:MAG: uroporphyrinogen-III synthase, partial [Terriglobia bacterium]
MKPHEHDSTSMTSEDRMSPAPLNGTIVLVTRPQNQSSDLTRQLEELGATVLHCATIEIRPPENWEGIDRAISGIDSYDWLVFTSANGARFFFDRSENVQRRAFHKPTSQLI